MSLKMPDLDDRTFDDLLAEALDQIRKDLHTSWNDFSPGDPGVILLETFAYLTEQMIYRLNRVPEKAYIAFLRMMGIGLKPPYAAHALLSFWQSKPDGRTIRVPSGTTVTAQPQGGAGTDSQSRNGKAITFMTVYDVYVRPDNCNEQTAVKALAYQASWVEEEFTSPGLPGQTITVSRPPILADAPGLKLRLGVEAAPDAWQVNDWVPVPGGKHYQDWEEVRNFASVSKNAHVFRVDRQAGIIYFAPAAYLYVPVDPKEAAENVDGHDRNLPQLYESRKQTLASIPEKGSIIRVRYAVGGGAAGNIPAGLLTTIQVPPGLAAQVTVTNEKPAQGGMDAETLANALVRGPQEVFTQDRLITARDFERAAQQAGQPDIARARVQALTDLWEHAAPGTVGITLVPALAGNKFNSAKNFTQFELESQQANLDTAALAGKDLRSKIKETLEEQSPMGVRHQLEWAKYKRVSVTADVAISNGEMEDVEQRLVKMLYDKISPLPSPESKKTPEEKGKPQDLLHRKISAQSTPVKEKSQETGEDGWGFGDSLHLADIARWIITSEPNIRLLNRLEVKIDSAPDSEVRALAADYFQADTWYAASGHRLFRSSNNGAGWEPLLDFSRGKTNLVKELDGSPKEITFVQTLKVISPNPYRAGLVALAAQNESSDQPRSPIYLSTDCGESWYWLAEFDSAIADMDWLERPGQHRYNLLLATSNGLVELRLSFNAHAGPSLEISPPIPVIDELNITAPVNAVKVLRGSSRIARVAVAMHSRRGVYLSSGADLTSTARGTSFKPLDLGSQSLIPPDIRCLGVQKCEPGDRYLLWAGGMALGPGDLGAGCCCWPFSAELRKLETDVSWAREGWVGGSCLGLAFLGNRVLAATARGTILAADVELSPSGGGLYGSLTGWKTFGDPQDVLPLRLVRFNGLPHDARARKHPWLACAAGYAVHRRKPDCSAGKKHPSLASAAGYPIYHRDHHWLTGKNRPAQPTTAGGGGQSQAAPAPALEEHIPFTSLATNNLASKSQPALIMAGCGEGIFRSLDAGKTFEKVSRDTFDQWKDSITLPPNWLLVSGEHVIHVDSAGLISADGTRKEAGHAAG